MEATARKPDVTNKYKDRKLIEVITIACPSDHNTDKPVDEKLQKYQQMAYKIKERRPDTMSRLSQWLLDT